MLFYNTRTNDSPVPTIHDSCTNYPNHFRLCRKNYEHFATRGILCWTKDRELLLHVISISPHHLEFNGAFLKTDYHLHNVWTAGFHCLVVLHTGKSKTWEKTTETFFPRCSVNRWSVKLKNNYRKILAPESHLNLVTILNVVSALQPATC